MGFDRRTFLQRSGLALLTLGVSPIGLSSFPEKHRATAWINRYYQTLAEPTPRKLALLVGINDYSQSINLRGCVTDVERQRDLLIHRFGFNPTDILILTDKQATREAIETAFIEHLIQQATTNDVVVFHFSGYGNQTKIPQLLQGKETDQSTYKLVNSLVPSDGISSTKGISVGNDLLEETLLLLGRSLATDKFTMVLDTSYQTTGKLLQGNLRLRSFSSISESANSQELSFQEELRVKNIGQGKRSQFSGMILAATGDNQIATEVTGNDFSAGLFTYALTQYLWQVTQNSNIVVALKNIAEQVELLNDKKPQNHLIRLKNIKKNLFPYYLIPDNPIGAEGVITTIDDTGTTEIQLTGIPLTVLDNYGINSCFTLVSLDKSNNLATEDNSQSKIVLPATILQLLSREGLRAKARQVNYGNSNNSKVEVGQLVQELIRVLPRQIGLTVALNDSLERIERVDATSAFANIVAVSSVVTPGEQAADCLLGRNQQISSPIDQNNLKTTNLSEENQSSLGGYGLFSVGGTLFADTVGVAGEAVKSAIQRLTPKLNQLLAAKLWRLTINEGTSRLGVSATLEIVSHTPQPLIRKDTRQQSSPVTFNANTWLSEQRSGLPSLAIGSQIQYRLENYSDRPIYFIVLGIDSVGHAIALYSPPLRDELAAQNSPSQLKNRFITAKETIIIPQASASFQWIVSGSVGLAQTLIICSQAPFTKTLEALAMIQTLKGNAQQVVDLPNPLEVAQALLQDLHIASTFPSEMLGTTSDIYALDVNAWATLSFIYQVV